MGCSALADRWISRRRNLHENLGCTSRAIRTVIVSLAAALGELERSVSRQDPDRWIPSVPSEGSSSAATNTATKHSPAWPATTTAPVKDTLAEPAPRRVATAARADYGIKTEAGSLVRAEFGKKCTFPTPIWTNTPIFFFFDSNRENLNFLASVIFFDDLTPIFWEK